MDQDKQDISVHIQPGAHIQLHLQNCAGPVEQVAQVTRGHPKAAFERSDALRQLQERLEVTESFQQERTGSQPSPVFRTNAQHTQAGLIHGRKVGGQARVTEVSAGLWTTVLHAGFRVR